MGKRGTICRTADVLYVKELTGDVITELQCCNPYRYVKIGKTRSYLGDQRNKQLNKSNHCVFTDLMRMLSLSHPTDINFKLTDNIVRDHIIASNPDIVSAMDKRQAIRYGIVEGNTEIIRFPYNFTTEQICSVVNKSYLTLLKSTLDNFIKNTDTKPDIEKEKTQNEFQVPANLMERAIEYYNLYKHLLPGSKVLVIRPHDPWLIASLIARDLDVTYIIDNYDYCCDGLMINHPNLHIVFTDNAYVDSAKSLENYIMKLEKDFDLLIANPPYRYANKIIVEAMKHCREGIVLMPGSNYREKDLFKNVINIEQISGDGFDNAVIADLTIATLDHKEHYSDYDDFVQFKYDEWVMPFVTLNSKIHHNYLYSCGGGDKQLLSELSSEYNFVFSGRVLDDGVHNDTSTDCQFNRYGVIKKDAYGCVVVKFPDKKYKDNFCSFWYDNPLMNKIIKSAHSSSFRTEFWNLVPKMDYSVDRDYANLTLEDIINILIEENPDAVK